MIFRCIAISKHSGLLKASVLYYMPSVVNNIYSHFMPGGWVGGGGAIWGLGVRGRFKNAHKLLNIRALKCSPVNKRHIFQCMRKILCVEFQTLPLKFHTKYLTHTLKDTIQYNVQILRALRFKCSYAFLKQPLILQCLVVWSINPKTTNFHLQKADYISLNDL